MSSTQVAVVSFWTEDTSVERGFTEGNRHTCSASVLLFYVLQISPGRMEPIIKSKEFASCKSVSRDVQTMYPEHRRSGLHWTTVYWQSWLCLKSFIETNCAVRSFFFLRKRSGVEPQINCGKIEDLQPQLRESAGRTEKESSPQGQI